MDPAAAPLGEVMAPISQEMALAGLRWDGVASPMRRDCEIQCNGKVCVGNDLAGPHTPLVHPGLHRALDCARYPVSRADTAPSR